MRNGEFIDEESKEIVDEDTKIDELSREERITQLLTQALPDASIDLENESHLHAGHAGAEDARGHFRLKIISEKFTGNPLDNLKNGSGYNTGHNTGF